MTTRDKILRLIESSSLDDEHCANSLQELIEKVIPLDGWDAVKTVLFEIPGDHKCSRGCPLLRLSFGRSCLKRDR
jgi:hypothetical protein